MTAFRDAFPILYTDDVRQAARWDTEKLGFELALRNPPADDDLAYVFLRLEPQGIGIGRSIPGNEAAGFERCIYTDDADAAAERLRAVGCEEVVAPRDEPSGERRAYFRDRSGHLLHIAAKL